MPVQKYGDLSDQSFGTKSYHTRLFSWCDSSIARGKGKKNLHLSAHLSRSLKNLLWVHLRVLHGTHLALS